MAVFAIPIPSITQEEIAKHAIAAVSCALNMGTQLRSLNQQGSIPNLSIHNFYPP
jgi:hypothetical protein